MTDTLSKLGVVEREGKFYSAKHPKALEASSPAPSQIVESARAKTILSGNSTRGKRSKLEERYYREILKPRIDDLCQSTDLAMARPCRLRLVLVEPLNGMKGETYTADWECVRRESGQIELHEVKGAHVFDGAREKFKQAVEKFPYITFYWSQFKDGKWDVQQVSVHQGQVWNTEATNG